MQNYQFQKNVYDWIIIINASMCNHHFNVEVSKVQGHFSYIISCECPHGD